MNSDHPVLTTFTKRVIDPTNVKPSDIHIFDIAHSLAKLDRYNGHLYTHYSVAQHSVIVSYLCPEGMELWGLLHDAPEYITGDLIKSIKSIPEIRAVWKPLEDKIMLQIASKFGLMWPMPPEVKEADEIAAIWERRDLQGVKTTRHELLARVPKTPLLPLVWQDAKQLFWERFDHLHGNGMMATGAR